MTLPTGETLPEYDDQHPEGVDIEALCDWLSRRFPHYWSAPGHLDDANRAVVERGHQLLIGQVLAALQAVGDATLVKNGTYRAMRKDGADVERLAARLAYSGSAGLLVECDGNPVTAALAILDALDITAPPPAVID